MMSFSIFERAGSFAENKDIAREVRVKEIVPALEKGQDVVLDFHGVDAATQSFIHALLSEIFRNYGISVLDRIEFKSCNTKVQKIIEIVVEYMQEGLSAEDEF